MIINVRPPSYDGGRRDYLMISVIGVLSACLIAFINLFVIGSTLRIALVAVALIALLLFTLILCVVSLLLCLVFGIAVLVS